MGEQKKTWIKPVLIVIGRGTPEERVLLGCKNAEGAGPATDGCRESATSMATCHAQGNS